MFSSNASDHDDPRLISLPDGWQAISRGDVITSHFQSFSDGCDLTIQISRPLRGFDGVLTFEVIQDEETNHLDQQDWVKEAGEHVRVPWSGMDCENYENLKEAIKENYYHCDEETRDAYQKTVEGELSDIYELFIAPNQDASDMDLTSVDDNPLDGDDE